MRNLKVTMGFRGTNYHGFQRQPNGITVQEVVETALSQLFNEPVTIQGCSRTDTGVHAKEYCFTMQTEKQLPERNFIRGACGYLPEDISIYRVEEMPPEFHARFSCKAKEYMYRIHNSESKNPFTTDLELLYRRKMDISLMQEAAQHFVGTHDFSAVRAVGTEVRSPVRTVHYFNITRTGDLIECRVCANGFLYNMVRAMVGTCVYAAEGKFAPEDVSAILESRNRTAAGPTVPPGGLYMTQLWYDEDVL